MWKKKQNVKEDKIMKNLYLVRGLPGSGKSTFARSIAKSYQIFEADQYFMKRGKYNFDPTKLKEAHNSCQLKCAERMKLQLSKIVIANTFTQEWEMEPYFEMAERYHYRVHTIIVENRHGNKNIHGVDEDKLKIMKDRFNIQL